MARAGPTPGSWICHMCDRTLRESEFSNDAYRERLNKAPGRCRDCDREYGRALAATSPTGKWADAPSHSEALHMAKETCRAHAWGKGYYTLTDKANALERVAAARSGGDPNERTFAERRQDEDKLQAAAERIAAERHQSLDRAARRRAENPPPPAPTAPPAADQDEDDKARKRALREWRRAKREAERRDEPPPPMPGTAAAGEEPA